MFAGWLAVFRACILLWAALSSLKPIFWLELSLENLSFISFSLCSTVHFWSSTIMFWSCKCAVNQWFAQAKIILICSSETWVDWLLPAVVCLTSACSFLVDCQALSRAPGKPRQVCLFLSPHMAPKGQVETYQLHDGEKILYSKVHTMQKVVMELTGMGVLRLDVLRPAWYSTIHNVAYKS